MLRPLFTRTPHYGCLSRSRRAASTKTSSASLPLHHDLSTFLAYARSNSLSSSSNVYNGTHYEYLCQSTLARLGFSLSRTGGPDDRGVDLLGTWSLPSLSPSGPLRCIVQCKSLKAKVMPGVVRELEGAFSGAPAGFGGDEVVGVLCSKREATKGVREAMRRSNRPVVWVMVEDLGGEEVKAGRVRQILWNQRVGDLGAEGMGVGLRYFPGSGGDGDERVQKEVLLTWKTELWEPKEEKSKEQREEVVLHTQ
ncbi:MAG: hypothetical protein Q9218_001480 [Villophora microphyllina]